MLTGVYSEETHLPQPLRISLDVELECIDHFAPDTPLSASKSYLDLKHAATGALPDGVHFPLIEGVADHIAETLFLEDPRVRRVQTKIVKLAIAEAAEQIGVREGRRVRGRYHVTAADIVEGKKHADAVCRVNFGFDVHNVRPGAMFEGDDEIAAEVRKYRSAGSKPYDIPLGALIAADVDGLMMAGRCISGDFIAHSSYRVTGNSVPMGEAAGRASVESLKRSCMPHELSWGEVKQS